MAGHNRRARAFVICVHKHEFILILGCHTFEDDLDHVEILVRVRINKRDYYGRTPLHYASKYRREEMANYLLDSAPDIMRMYTRHFRITAARHHKASEEGFFDNYSDWTRGPEEYEVEIEFIWITLDEGKRSYKPESATRPPNSPRRKPYQAPIAEACNCWRRKLPTGPKAAHILDNRRSCSLVSHRTERRCVMLHQKQKMIATPKRKLVRGGVFVWLI